VVCAFDLTFYFLLSVENLCVTWLPPMPDPPPSRRAFLEPHLDTVTTVNTATPPCHTGEGSVMRPGGRVNVEDRKRTRSCFSFPEMRFSAACLDANFDLDLVVATGHAWVGG